MNLSGTASIWARPLLGKHSEKHIHILQYHWTGLYGGQSRAGLRAISLPSHACIKGYAPMLTRIFPFLTWSRSYQRSDLTNDLIAAAVVTIMLIPQGMAYAMLAGLPPQAGLYGAIVPLLLYAAFGSSRALAVGPVAVVALMTAAAAGTVAEIGGPGYHLAALWLALLSGAIMLVMGLFRLGFIANFLSHPVISGFITAAGILIAASQLRHLLGADVTGKTLPQVVPSLVTSLGDISALTVALSAAVLGFLFWSRAGLAKLLQRLGMSAPLAKLLGKGA